MAEDKREPTRALDKASRVMDALAAENGLSPADIADACDIPRSSVYRVLDGLVDVGWAVTDTDGNYSLSLDWLRLADAPPPTALLMPLARLVPNGSLRLRSCMPSPRKPA